MTTKKMSYVGAVNVAIDELRKLTPETADANLAEVVEKLEALKVSLEKRSTRKVTGPTKAQIERAALAERVFAEMVEGESYTFADIAKLIPELDGASSQRITPLMKPLVTDGRVNAAKVKGKLTYTLAA